MSTEKINIVENILGAQLKAERRRRGLTQARLADMLKISDAYVSALEKGTREPSEIVLQEINRFLHGGCSLPVSGHADECVCHTSHYIEKVAQMMKEMDEDTQKDICLSVEKEKLLRDLMREREAKKVA